MDEHSTQSTVEVEASAHKKDVDLMSPDVTMLVLTWVTFFLLLAILQKFAWKPILEALQKREDAIRTSLDQADKIKTAFDDIQQSKEDVLAKAHRSAQDIVEQSRKAAVEAAHVITNKAREETKIMTENALREINEEKLKAQVQLRQTAAEIAIQLASKLIEENLNDKRNQELIDRYIKQL